MCSAAAATAARRCSELIRDSHEPPRRRRRTRKRAWQLFRALVDRKIIEFIPETERRRVRCA